MRLDVNRVRQCLKDGDFKRLFIEELGWDRHNLFRYAVSPKGLVCIERGDL